MITDFFTTKALFQGSPLAAWPELELRHYSPSKNLSCFRLCAVMFNKKSKSKSNVQLGSRESLDGSGGNLVSDRGKVTVVALDENWCGSQEWGLFTTCQTHVALTRTILDETDPEVRAFPPFIGTSHATQQWLWSAQQLYVSMAILVLP